MADAEFYIQMISQLSDRYGNELINMMEENKKSNLREITYEEARAYYERLITMQLDNDCKNLVLGTSLDKTTKEGKCNREADNKPTAQAILL